MKLYYMPGASSLAAHIALEWTAAAYDAVRMDRRALRTPEYLALSPAGAVPLLVDGDLALAESVAILGYLADLHPHLQLAGDGSPRARAEVMRWLAYLNSDVNGAFRPIFFPGRYLGNHAFATAMADTAREHVRECLQRLDRQLEGRTWLTGSRSVADAYLFVMLRWALGTKVGLQGFDALTAFLRRMHQDDGVHAALVLEEGLAPRTASARRAGDALQRLEERLAGRRSTTLSAEVVGAVEYREGEGMALEVRRGLVQVEITPMDTVISWADEKYRGEAAIPYANFTHYVSDGAIRLAL
ncbi:glutathione S-transferase family protein [Streptococcus pyogenes]|uniref:glutathione S-transferase family protein n=1 Tax=Streptococcus pyogenes TaxID=1314 RepID=UPI003DA0CCCA